ncbi:hypothetical protein RYX36_037257, partial [Vicia faba]
MVTPFVPSPGSNWVKKSNPGAWLILRPGRDGTWKPEVEVGGETRDLCGGCCGICCSCSCLGFEHECVQIILSETTKGIA